MVKKTALEKFEEMCYFLAEWIKKLQFLRTFLSVYTTRKKTLVRIDVKQFSWTRQISGL